MKERLATVFMTLSVVATLGLGGAVAYAFAHQGGTSERSAAATEAPATTSSGAVLGTSTTRGGTVKTGGGTVTGGSVAAGGKTSSGSTGSHTSGVVGTTKSTHHSSATPSSHSTSKKQSAHHTGKKAKATAPASTQQASGQQASSQQNNPQQGVNNGVITVGGIYDETGPIDATVERDTVRSYFDAVNAAGGVNGYKFQLVDCDSKYDPSAAHQCAQKLVSEGVLAIVGWLSLSGEQSETPYLTQQGVPIIGGLGVPAEFASPLSYPTTPSLVTEGSALGTRAGQLHLQKPGVIFLNANFIAPVESSFLSAMKAQGITPVDVETVDATKPDYSDIILKFRADGAQSVAAFLDPFSYARLFQAMERQAWHPPVLGGGLDKASANAQYDSGCGSSCAVFGAESATPVLEYLDHASTPAIGQYLGTVRKYYPSQYPALDTYSTYQWLAAEVFVQAVKDIGNGPVNRQTLVNALNGIKNFDDGGLTEPFSYAPGSGHDPLHCLQWIHNYNGSWKTTSGWNCF
jgi:ABC-type branched-subunit amino acid transport system substrate-binding protein